MDKQPRFQRKGYKYAKDLRKRLQALTKKRKEGAQNGKAS